MQDSDRLNKNTTRILTKKKKVFYIVLFLIGAICSYPTLFPIGIVIAAALLFKKNNWKINLLGLIVIALIIVNITVFLLLELEIRGMWVR